jgi:hypothetical protein
LRFSSQNFGRSTDEIAPRLANNGFTETNLIDIASCPKFGMLVLALDVAEFAGIKAVPARRDEKYLGT